MTPTPALLRRRHGLLLRGWALLAAGGLGALALDVPAWAGLVVLGLALLLAALAGRARAAHRAAVTARRGRR